MTIKVFTSERQLAVPCDRIDFHGPTGGVAIQLVDEDMVWVSVSDKNRKRIGRRVPIKWLINILRNGISRELDRRTK